MTSLFVAALLLVLQGIPPLVGPLIPDSNGTVTGVIRRADSGQPIPDVLVAVAGASESFEKAMSRAVPTDRNGRFTIRDVQPGTYTVIAQRDGFFSPSAQSSDAVQAFHGVVVFEGQMSDVGALDLIAGAAISGRIAGPDRLPLASATVQVLRASYTRGRRTLTPIKTTLTDDIGEYRLFWLPPGAYYVRAQYRTTTADSSARYDRMFFPGIAEEDAAPSIIVGASSEVSGIDILVPTTPVRGVALSGRVTAAAEDASAQRVTGVYVVPRGRRVQLADDDADMYANRAADTSSGQFEIRNVPPGSYELFPVVRDGSGKVRTVQLAIEVEDRNIESIAAILDPPLELRGRVTWDGGAPGDRLPKDSILISPLDGIPGIGGADVAITPDPDTGDFVVSLQPGRYSVQPASSLFSSNAYVADVKREEANVFDAGFTLSEGTPEPLVVEMKSQGGSVSGTAIDSTRLRPSAYATVVLVPEPARRRNLALYRHGRSAADGAFKFTGLPPGNYKLFAWVSVQAGAWENAAFLERFEDRGIPVVVEAGVDRSLQLNVIR